MKNIAIFASGSGTNAENIIRHFSTRKSAKVVAVFVNNPQAGVIKRVTGTGTGVIVLAGFLWHIPAPITVRYEGRLVNIHPALLPGFGGKGMYGDRVHRAVIDSGSDKTGITIHYVNEVYDAGDIIFQAECPVLPGDTPQTLADRVHALEYRYYPTVIEEIIEKL
ncbi:MAG: phosphoribosylglycinamide formyltransferase [Bacteroidetes bacterium]|nr:phosphoribosylglycinamide formyltransferase [Bacteroidota bacterium]